MYWNRLYRDPGIWTTRGTNNEYVYIYIYREREMYMYKYMYVYTYVYIYIYIFTWLRAPLAPALDVAQALDGAQLLPGAHVPEQDLFGTGLMGT